MIKKYIQFIKEADETVEVQSEKETDASDSSKFLEVKRISFLILCATSLFTVFR